MTLGVFLLMGAVLALLFVGALVVVYRLNRSEVRRGHGPAAPPPTGGGPGD